MKDDLIDFDLKDYFEENQLMQIEGIFIKNQDRVFIDENIDNIKTVILSIFMVSNKNKKSKVSRKDCYKLYTFLGKKPDRFRKILFELKKKDILDYDENNMSLRPKGLKILSEMLGGIQKSKVRLIKSGQNFSAIKEFELFLNEEIKGPYLKLIDFYISPETIHPLAVLFNKSFHKIEILTANISEKDKLRDYLKKFEKESKIKIKIKINQKIHDRILITKNSCWNIGSSIKDLGNKDATIKELKEVKDSLEELFEERWKESKSIFYPEPNKS